MTTRTRVALMVIIGVGVIGVAIFAALRLHHDAPPDTTQSLLQDLESVAPEVRAHAESEVGNRAEQFLPLLVQIISGTNALHRGSSGGSAKERLETGYSNERTRRQAIRAFEVLGPKGRPVLNDLVALMSQTSHVFYAARALAGIGAVQELRSFQEKPEPVVRAAVATALGRVTTDAHEAAMALLAAVKDPDPTVRAAAADSLGHVGSESERAVPALVDALKDKEETVRFAAAKSLGKHARHAKSAVPALEAVREDKDRQVRRAVRQTLELIKLENP